MATLTSNEVDVGELKSIADPVGTDHTGAGYHVIKLVLE